MSSLDNVDPSWMFTRGGSEKCRIYSAWGAQKAEKIQRSKFPLPASPSSWKLYDVLVVKSSASKKKFPRAEDWKMKSYPLHVAQRACHCRISIKTLSVNIFLAPPASALVVQAGENIKKCFAI